MAGKNYTLYLQEHEIEVVKRAGKLLSFHEDSGVGRILYKAALDVLLKYGETPPTQQGE